MQTLSLYLFTKTSMVSFVMKCKENPPVDLGESLNWGPKSTADSSNWDVNVLFYNEESCFRGRVWLFGENMTLRGFSFLWLGWEGGSKAIKWYSQQQARPSKVAAGRGQETWSDGPWEEEWPMNSGALTSECQLNPSFSAYNLLMLFSRLREEVKYHSLC